LKTTHKGKVFKALEIVGVTAWPAYWLVWLILHCTGYMPCSTSTLPYFDLAAARRYFLIDSLLPNFAECIEFQYVSTTNGAAYRAGLPRSGMIKKPLVRT
jgi:hypothetical protein